MDFSAMAFGVAVGMLETMPNEVEILCSADEAVEAYKLQKEFGCKVVLLPNELLKTQFHWAVRTASALVWSTGC